MRRAILTVSAAALAACAAAPAGEDAPATRPERPRAAAPTTRLVPAQRARGDLDCADFADQGAAQDALSADASDPHRLDADRDSVACEKLIRPR